MTDAVCANQPPVLSAPRRLRLPNRRRAFALALGGALLLACLLAAAGRGPGGSGARARLARSARLSGIAVFLLVMLANGALALPAVRSR